MGFKEIEDNAFSAFWSTSSKPATSIKKTQYANNTSPTRRVVAPPYRATRIRYVYVKPKKNSVYVKPKKNSFAPIAKQAAQFIKARSPIQSYESRANYERERYVGRVKELQAKKELSEFSERNRELSRQRRQEVLQKLKNIKAKLPTPKRSIYGSKSIRSLSQLFGGKR